MEETVINYSFFFKLCDMATRHKHTYDLCMNHFVFILITTKMKKVGKFKVTSKNLM